MQISYADASAQFWHPLEIGETCCYKPRRHEGCHCKSPFCHHVVSGIIVMIPFYRNVLFIPT